MNKMVNLDELINEFLSIKTNVEENKVHLFIESLNKYDLYQSEPFFVVSKMKLNSPNKIGNNFTSYWNKENSLAMIFHYINNSSFIHKDIIMFYEKDALESLFKSDFNGEKYIILGIKKPRKTNNPKLDDLFKDARINTWNIVSTYDEFIEEKECYLEENFYIFKLNTNTTEELLDRFQKAATLTNYQIEKNCFDMSNNADNSGKFRVHMKGDIIITDPCYIIKNRDESSRPKWSDFHPYNSIYEYPDYDEKTRSSKMFSENAKRLEEADEEWCKQHLDDRDFWDDNNLSFFGFTTYLTHNTLYGDWGCHTFNEDTNEVIGRFCADSGEVGVFLLDEVLRYNPDYKDYKDSSFAVTFIKDFDGDVWFEKLDSETLIVRGRGNVNFFTKQTSL